MNTVNLTGRFVRDPETRQTQSGVRVTTFTLAVNRPYQKDKQEADFISCTAWRTTAEFIGKYFAKGDPIELTGSLRTRTYEKDGTKHYITEVLVENVSFTLSKSNGRASNDSNSNDANVSIGDFGDFEEILGDGDTPF